MLCALVLQDNSHSCHRPTDLSETEASLAMIELTFLLKLNITFVQSFSLTHYHPLFPPPDHSIIVQTFSTVKSTTAEKKKRTSFWQEIDRLHVQTAKTALML
jgi:hypothetical protein